MADIRINSLPSTATSFNTDDYIAIDGASGGTRKMLAATLPLTDVTLGGSSGPSVKSTLSARAPRQGLVFDSSAHGGAPIANQPAFGTSDFTLTAWVNPVAVASNAYILSSVSDSASLFFTGSTVQWIANASAVISVAGGVVAGKSQLLVITRNAGTTTYYYNGVAVSTTSSGSGNLANPIVKMGSSASGASGHFNGTISALIYNRALSASEVVALYEAGAPAGADYPATVAGTDIVTSGNFSSATGWAVGSAWSISGGVATTNGTADGGGSTELAQTGKSFKAGQRIRVKFTLGNVSAGGFRIIFYGGSANTLTTIRTASGTYTEEVVLAGSATAFQTIASISGVSLNNGATLDDLSIVPLGLLLAPDAAQAGGGLVWYDTSGNAANITLPASGVSWNVPSSLKLGGNWTAAGNLNASGGFYVSGSAVSPNNTACVDLSFQTTYGKVSAINRGVGNFPLALNPEGGSVLVNTTTNSGNGAVQLATHTTSAGGIGFGTVTSLYASSISGCLELAAASGTTGGFKLYNTTNMRGQFVYSGTDVYIDSSAASSQLIFRTNGSTTALTLDSSQNATFAGAITSSRPYQDISSGLSNIYVYSTDTAAQDKGGTIQLGGAYTGTTTTTFGGVRGSKESTTAGETGGQLEFFTRANGGAMTRRAYISSTGNATFTGSIAIGNTVNTVSPTSPNRTITMVIGGTTYYIHAKTTND